MHKLPLLSFASVSNDEQYLVLRTSTQNSHYLRTFIRRQNELFAVVCNLFYIKGKSKTTPLLHYDGFDPE